MYECMKKYVLYLQLTKAVKRISVYTWLALNERSGVQLQTRRLFNGVAIVSFDALPLLLTFIWNFFGNSFAFIFMA